MLWIKKQGTKKKFQVTHLSFACWGQYEGAVAEDGKSPSIWNTWAHSGKQLSFKYLIWVQNHRRSFDL
jgi:beta-glucosidase/6-phospho-beta-glucosidase/beta-galactosidase